MYPPRTPELVHRPSFWRAHLLPIAIALICASWIFQVHIYLPSDSPWIPKLLIGLAFLLILARILSRNREPWTERLTHPPRASILGLVACLMVLLIFPCPYNMGAVPLGVGWISLSFFRRHSLGGYFSAALLQIGLLLLISAALLPLLSVWASNVHELTGPAYFLTSALGGLLKLLGQTVDQIGNALYLRTFEDLYPQTITAEKFLPLALALFAVVWSAIILLRSEQNRVERLVLFWLLLSGFCVLRLALLMLIMVQRVNPSYYWDPVFMTLSLVSLSFIVREPDDLPSSRRPSLKARLVSRPWRLSLLLGLILGSGIVVALTFRDPGTRNAGRLLINEHGSDWEWTTDPLNTEDYNERTTYNYYCMAEYLKYYYEVTVNFEPLSPENLRDVNVLILKTPTQPYESAEIEAVVDFVQQGGGVWVIGDHTNVFGSSTYLNPLIRRFGFRLNYDSTHDLQTGKLSLYQKPPLFAHPTVVNLPPYLFATSCSIVAPWSAESAIIGYGLRADYLDYSQKNFFPDRSRKQFNFRFGLFLQQAGGKFGRGRLLIYTDSTTFSNFFIFIRGKPELVLGSLEWLNRSNRYAWVNTVALVIGFVAFVLLFVLRAWNGAALSGLLLGAALLGWLTDSAAGSAYSLPDPSRSVPWINFEREHSQYFLPTLRLGEEGDKSHLTFFVWTQRVGAVPREVHSFEDAVSGNDPVFMIDPGQPLDANEMEALRSYLLRGGKLLLINSADNTSDAPTRILDEYGLNLQTVASPSDTLHTLTLAGRYFPLLIKGKFSSLTGGDPFLKSDQGDVIGAAAPVGKGGIWALSCGHIFRNSGMGHTTVIPDEGLKALYEIEFDLVRELLSKSPPEKTSETPETNDDQSKMN